jgi:hypothetical protein
VKKSSQEEKFLLNAKLKRAGKENLSDVRTYDALRDRTHSEIATGQFSTLTDYLVGRECKIIGKSKN